MRGEHPDVRVQRHGMAGSSPHARGTHVRSCYPLFDAGIIPACAGNTRPANTRTARPWDHPRMRGEHAVSILASRIEWGSSPHARGTPTGCCHADGPPRDHPRMRGEHWVPNCAWAYALGSSPHARGTRTPNTKFKLCNGIIPACAGNTALTLPNTTSARDHPRMRGEHILRLSSLALTAGSSPHARGTQKTHASPLGNLGIIPACAGNTLGRLMRCRLMWDHPRMRGEHVFNFGVLFFCMGSSPHARGTHRREGVHRDGTGIIPACAGNTGNLLRRIFDAGDHPRMRGEHYPVRKRCEYGRGSSPHARGTLQLYEMDAEHEGIIPACAGNTSSWDGSSAPPEDHPRMRGEHDCVLFFLLFFWDHPRMRGEHPDPTTLS